MLLLVSAPDKYQHSTFRLPRIISHPHRLSKGLAKINRILTSVQRVLLWKQMFSLDQRKPQEKTNFSLRLFIIAEYLLHARYCGKWCTDSKTIRTHQGRWTSKKLATVRMVQEEKRGFRRKLLSQKQKLIRCLYVELSRGNILAFWGNGRPQVWLKSGRSYFWEMRLSADCGKVIFHAEKKKIVRE